MTIKRTANRDKKHTHEQNNHEADTTTTMKFCDNDKLNVHLFDVSSLLNFRKQVDLYFRCPMFVMI